MNNMVLQICMKCKAFKSKINVINYIKNNKSENLVEIQKYLSKRLFLDIFPYNDYNLQKINVKVYRDKNSKLFYVYKNNKKLFFPSEMKFKFLVKRYYNSLCKEQSEFSPHKYTDNDHKVSDNSVILDIGSAEGIFALDNVEKAKAIYLFEYDKKWIKALQETFKDYDNVFIIEKYVSNIVDDKNITLNEFSNQININSKKVFIKMDIEGCEVLTLQNCKKLLDLFEDVKLSVCCYHTQNSEKEIRKIFKKSKITTSDRYMLFYLSEDFQEPYFRHGVLKINYKCEGDLCAKK